MPLDDISTPELTRSLVDASMETGRQVGALVHRSGQVDYVVVGDAGKLMRFNAALLEQGVLKADQKIYMSLAHTDADIAETAQAFQRALAVVG